MSDPILSGQQIAQITKRIAYQIHENNMEEDIVLVGVDDGGRKFAESLREVLLSVSDQKVVCSTIEIDKENPLSQEIELVDGSFEELEDKIIILCDDVLNSGRTLAYSMSKVLSVNVKKLEIAILVLRNHSRFPVYAKYRGYELSTTINEHVSVDLEKGVFLT